MKKKTGLVKGVGVFEDKEVRKTWHNEQWYFSVIDIVAVLTEQTDFQLARNYWKVLKNRLIKEGSEVVTNCQRLKMQNN